MSVYSVGYICSYTDIESGIDLKRLSQGVTINCLCPRALRPVQDQGLFL